jgi:hypothetical protein
MNRKVYNPRQDVQFSKPFIDIDEWKEGAVRYHYIHGGFENNDLRFAFFFPEKSDYKGRFFHFMCPVPGNENAAMAGEGDKITFAIKNGAYFVETNMGVTNSFGAIQDPAIIYKASAAAAEYSREVANTLFGPHRPYGYIFGGSGGGYKTISCIENTNAWDGAVPFVTGTPMSIPYSLTCAAHAGRVLRSKFPQIVDAMEAGGSKNPYEVLNAEEADALREITDFGTPLRAWCALKLGDSGSLPILAPAVKSADPGYYTDFWVKPGYLGAEPNSSAVRDRLQLKSTVLRLDIPDSITRQNWEDRTGVDDAWQRLARKGGNEKICLFLDKMPASGAYIAGAELKVLSGVLSGKTLPIESIDDEKIVLGGVFGVDAILDDLKNLQPGDEVLLDNSDFIAIQTYHRHQIPKESSYSIYDQYKDSNGNPVYPQRGFIFGPQIAMGGAGSLQTGRFGCKVIQIAALLDGNLPWCAHWYKEKAAEFLDQGLNENYRLWFIDNAVHSDEQISGDELHIAGYAGVLHQALLDVSDWVERGIAPASSTAYKLDGNVVEVDAAADLRGGIQPVIYLTTNGKDCTTVPCGSTVEFQAIVEIPPGAGKITKAEWSFEGESDFPYTSDSADKTPTGMLIKGRHKYNNRGTFFAVLKVYLNRVGNEDDAFTQVKNLSRVRVSIY